MYFIDNCIYWAYTAFVRPKLALWQPCVLECSNDQSEQNAPGSTASTQHVRLTSQQFSGTKKRSSSSWVVQANPCLEASKHYEITFTAFQDLNTKKLWIFPCSTTKRMHHQLQSLISMKLLRSQEEIEGVKYCHCLCSLPSIDLSSSRDVDKLKDGLSIDPCNDGE